MDFDAYGNPKRTEVEVDTAGGLSRDNTDSLNAISPTTTGWIEAGKTWYDAFGNTVFEAGQPNRCHQVDFDTRYALVPSDEV